MTQAEKRHYLITELLKELSEYDKIKIPTNETEQKKLLRSLLNIRMPLPVSDDFFVQDEGWCAAVRRYEDFIRQHKGTHILFLELGVGMSTPVIIKYPFWQMTAQNPNAVYACVNFGESYCPSDIMKQSICINDDIGKTISSVARI